MCMVNEILTYPQQAIRISYRFVTVELSADKNPAFATLSPALRLMTNWPMIVPIKSRLIQTCHPPFGAQIYLVSHVLAHPNRLIQ